LVCVVNTDLDLRTDSSAQVLDAQQLSQRVRKTMTS
jgi:hypothetical protein